MISYTCIFFKVFRHITWIILHFITSLEGSRDKYYCPILQMKCVITKWPLSKCLQNIFKQFVRDFSSGLLHCGGNWAVSVAVDCQGHHSSGDCPCHCDWDTQECVHFFPNKRQSSHGKLFFFLWFHLKKIFILYWSTVD